MSAVRQQADVTAPRRLQRMKSNLLLGKPTDKTKAGDTALP